ncbi:hypothetical protein IAT38_005789 [Cryptococcus sp. DSM 104549]
MAFSSLADELAGAFDDHPNGGTGGGGGVSQSLAAEFGLEYEPEGEGDDDDFGHEFAGTPPRSQFDRPARRQHAQRGSPSTRSSLSGSMPAYSPDRAHGLQDDLDLDLAFEGDNSFAAPLGDELEAELGRGPHDGEGDLLEGENALEPNSKLSAHQGTPSRSSLSPSINGARSMTSTRSLRRGPAEAEQDPLVVLSETLAVTGKFLTSLRHLDEASSEGGRSPVSKRGVGAAVPRGATEVKVKVEGPVDVLLQVHLTKLQESERVREEQLRELGVIGREMTTVRWGEGLDTEAPSGGLEVLAEDEDEWKGGWTGDAKRGIDEVEAAEEGKSEAAVEVALDVDRQLEDDEHIDPLDAMLEESDPFSVPASHSPRSHPIDQDHSPTHSTRPQALPSHIDSLLSVSFSLHTSLRRLSDTLHTSSSMSAWLARQVRGIRAAAEGFREREDQEEEARKAVEEWEGRKVREGLAGGGGGVKEGLRRECEEFEGKLEEWGREMERIRRGVVA